MPSGQHEPTRADRHAVAQSDARRRHRFLRATPERVRASERVRQTNFRMSELERALTSFRTVGEGADLVEPGGQEPSAKNSQLPSALTGDLPAPAVPTESGLLDIRHRGAVTERSTARSSCVTLAGVGPEHQAGYSGTSGIVRRRRGISSCGPHRDGSRAISSMFAMTNRRPSGLNATAVTVRSCSRVCTARD
jgi:hypothetical protein